MVREHVHCAEGQVSRCPHSSHLVVSVYLVSTGVNVQQGKELGSLTHDAMAKCGTSLTACSPK